MKAHISSVYKAFISYSHAADGKLAPALHSALHRFAKPWYQLRGLHVFRDKTSLSLTPALWPSIAKALDDSEYFILMASPEAAASHWVQQEVDHWLAHRSIDKLLIVLTGGALVWDQSVARCDGRETTAIPSKLQDALCEEPFFLDLRWARTEEDLSLNNPRFRDAVAELAATLHGVACRVGDRRKDSTASSKLRGNRRPCCCCTIVDCDARSRATASCNRFCAMLRCSPQGRDDRRGHPPAPTCQEARVVRHFRARGAHAGVSGGRLVRCAAAQCGGRWR